MKALRYRDVFKNGRACAWLRHVRNLSGAYVIRKKKAIMKFNTLANLIPARSLKQSNGISIHGVTRRGIITL